MELLVVLALGALGAAIGIAAARIRSGRIALTLALIAPPILAWALYWLVASSAVAEAQRGEFLGWQLLAVIGGAVAGIPCSVISLVVCRRPAQGPGAGARP